MFNLIKRLIQRLFLFLLPIVRTAAAQVAADMLSAKTKTERERTGKFDSKLDTVTPVYGSPNWHRLQNSMAPVPFHDVLMVAFDISGPNLDIVKEFLYNNMPRTGDTVFADRIINLDSFWIADDVAGDSNCDSAVFVAKGKQAWARRVLRDTGLVK